ncbi:MAG: hypothetical protein QOD82_892, partial [Pseudonocardiales bacterium]|nr:hypothetical protein [Pseudonocardiales bacterium]
EARRSELFSVVLCSLIWEFVSPCDS